MFRHLLGSRQVAECINNRKGSEGSTVPSGTNNCFDKKLVQQSAQDCKKREATSICIVAGLEIRVKAREFHFQGSYC